MTTLWTILLVCLSILSGLSDSLSMRNISDSETDHDNINLKRRDSLSMKTINKQYSDSDNKVVIYTENSTVGDSDTDHDNFKHGTNINDDSKQAGMKSKYLCWSFIILCPLK